ncbi:MAG: GspE/PulE family protein [Alphaproteobacteria bacterium]
MQDEDTNNKDSINKNRKASSGKGYDPGLENFQDFTVMEGLPDNKGDDLYSKSPPKDDGFEKPKETQEDWSKVNVGGLAKSQEVRGENNNPNNLNIPGQQAQPPAELPPVQGVVIDQDPVLEDRPAEGSASAGAGEFIDFTIQDTIEDTAGQSSSGDAAKSENNSADNNGDVNLPARYGNPVTGRPEGAKAKEQGEGGAIARRHTEIKAKAQEAMAADDGERKNRLGDRLVGMGIITPDQLNVALQEKKITGKMIGEVMVDLGFIDEETLTAVLAEDAGFEVFDPKQTIVDGDALSLVEKAVAQKHKILPISMDEKYLYVAMSDPYDVLAMDTLRRYVPKGLNIKPVVTSATVISDAIDAAYGYASSISDILKELEEGQHQDVASLNEEDAFSHPIVRLVNALVIDAVKLGVSDLHFEPEENFVRLRYRLDGVLFTAQILHKQHWNGISQRLKLMSEMNIADKLSPQDGRFGLNAGGKEVDFRVSSLPTVHGENIVLRVLDKSSSIMPMEKLGFSPENMKKIKDSQSKPEGIIIVTGPTGSGKSTSLYSMLNEINDVEINIQTLEDPVEYSLPMIRQTHVREGVLEFADGIKALLRQDPDIIFIGEIRDKTTAEMALKAAMTGHQVYTTLHTNDSFGAIPRLLDLGLKPGMIAGAIIAVFAQRLTRRLCENCKEEYRPSSEECRILAVNSENPPRIFRARQGGCDMCAGQGYKGRVAVAEVLTFDEDMDELLARGESKAELKVMAEKKGFKNMRDDGILKVLDGLTDLAALSRVVDIRK